VKGSPEPELHSWTSNQGPLTQFILSLFLGAVYPWALPPSRLLGPIQQGTCPRRVLSGWPEPALWEASALRRRGWHRVRYCVLLTERLGLQGPGPGSFFFPCPHAFLQQPSWKSCLPTWPQFLHVLRRGLDSRVLRTLLALALESFQMSALVIHCYVASHHK
jgi:hypothetical protein